MNTELDINREKAIQILKTGFPKGKLFCSSITGYSMYPMIHPKSRVFLSTQISPEQIVVGDIVAIAQRHTILAHRVIFIRKRKGKPVLFLTKGDWNRNFDSTFTPNQVLGKIVAIDKRHKEICLTRPLWKMAGLFIAFFSGISGFLQQRINRRPFSGRIIRRLNSLYNKLLFLIQFIFLSINNLIYTNQTGMDSHEYRSS